MYTSQPDKGTLNADGLDVKAETAGYATRVTFHSSVGANNALLCRYAILVGNPPKKIMTRYLPRFSRSAKVDYYPLYHMNVATDETRQAFLAKVRAAMLRF